MKHRFLSLFSATLIAFVSHASAQTVVEYVNSADFPRSPGGQYFYSADPGEQAFVDSGGAGQFKRTGAAFRAGGATPLCRFYGSVTPGPNSHFYTVDAGECNALKAAQLSPKPAATQQWNYEGNGFAGAPPSVDASGKKFCAAGSVPVYRAYNGAFSAAGKKPWDSNHRYSTNKGDIDYLVAIERWNDEGLSFCAAASVPIANLPTIAANEKRCVAPRSVASYKDKPGTLDNEKAWIRAFMEERYLWPDEVPAILSANFNTAQTYFDPLKTHAKTASGKDKDEFHFQLLTSEWEKFDTGEAGVGYGLTITPKTTTRPATIALVEPGSPAGIAGLKRGMQVRSINGLADTSAAFPNALQNALRPRAAGAPNTFGVFDPAANSQRDVSLQAAAITSVPVQNVTTIPTPTGKVGYMLFNDFNLPSEGLLIEGFTKLKTEGVSDLVLDLRYNGGGYVYIASQVAYMIAGAKTANKIFEKFIFSSRRPGDNNDPDNATEFYDISSGIRGTNTIENAPLPTLNLNRVFILVSDNTASASESVINSLRGIDVEVVLIGNTTVGKPYGFVPEDNCSTTYFAVEFKGVNNKGFGDFADGFAPTCKVVDDDVTHDFTDPAETRLAAALAYRATGQCPTGTIAAGDQSKTASERFAAQRFMGKLRMPEQERALIQHMDVKRALAAQ
jgi:carboxyl-terminal processing protease